VAIPSFAASDCYRGPCYSYEACITDKCQIHAGCVINTILQFWARHYRAVVAYVEPVVTPALAAARAARLALPALGVLQLIGEELTADAAPPPGAVSDGCPPGTTWRIGLTGFSCQGPEHGGPIATREQLVAAGILPA